MTITAVGSFVDNTILNNHVVTLSVSPSATPATLSVTFFFSTPAGLTISFQKTLAAG